MRSLMLSHPRRVLLAALFAGGSAVGELGAQLPGQTAPPDKMTDRVPDEVRNPAAQPGPVLAPAPFVRPASGTRAVYTDRAFTVTKATGWRVDVVDDAKQPRAIMGGFIPDSASPPLIMGERVFGELWPLKVGQRIQIETQRFPTLWRWDIAVTTTERVKTEAGTFDCFVVDATVVTIAKGRRVTLTDRTLYWYAPSINAIVRVYERHDGAMNVRERRFDLVRLERPGMAPVGVAAPVAAAAAKGIPRPR